VNIGDNPRRLANQDIPLDIERSLKRAIYTHVGLAAKFAFQRGVRAENGFKTDRLARHLGLLTSAGRCRLYRCRSLGLTRSEHNVPLLCHKLLMRL